MKQQAITIKDIAKALNLSYSTVSRALKNSYKISAATTRLVKEYAEKNNYRPNLMAQSLKSKKTRSIGVLLSSVPNNFFAEVISGIESVAYSKDYQVIIAQSHESFERELKNLEHLLWRSVDGLLVSLSSFSKDIQHLTNTQKGGTPIVLFDRVSTSLITHQVVTDNEGGAYLGTKHLLDNGYRNIAHITSDSQMSITEGRLRGYKRALAMYNIPFKESLVQYCPHGGMIKEEVESAISYLLQSNTPPDALITASDRITIQTLSILKEKQVKIPQQCAVVGFTNFSAPELFSPSLTAIVQPAFEMGKAAAVALFELIEQPLRLKKYTTTTLPAVLEIRASSSKKE